jgi:hypothetical protein
MKNKSIIILTTLAIACLAGCVQVSGTRKPDGTLQVSTHRFFWSSEGINFSTTSASNGNFSTTLSVQKSSTDAAALGAVAAGVAQGLAGAVKP